MTCAIANSTLVRSVHSICIFSLLNHSSASVLCSDEDELFVSEGEGFRPLCCRVASVTSLDAITRSPRQLAHVSGESTSWTFLPL